MKIWLLILVIAVAIWFLASNVVFFIKDYKKCNCHKRGTFANGIWCFQGDYKKIKNLKEYPSYEGYLNSIFNAFAYYGAALPLIAPWIIVKGVMLTFDAIILKRRYWYINRIARNKYINHLIIDTVEKNLNANNVFYEINLIYKEISRIETLKHVKDECFEYADLYYYDDSHSTVLQKIRIKL